MSLETTLNFSLLYYPDNDLYQFILPEAGT